MATDMEFYNPVIERIRHVMKEQGLSQKAVAARMGWSHCVMSKLMNGKRKLWLRDIIPLCEVLGVSSDYLLVRDEFIKSDLSTRVETSFQPVAVVDMDEEMFGVPLTSEIEEVKFKNSSVYFILRGKNQDGLAKWLKTNILEPPLGLRGGEEE